MTFSLVVDDLRILFVALVFTATSRVLQLSNGVWCPQVIFTADTECVFTAGFQHVFQYWVSRECAFMHADCFFCYIEQADTFDFRWGAGEVFVYKCFLQTNRFEDLCAGVRHVSGDTHLRHDFAQTFANCFHEVSNVFLFFGCITARHFTQGFHSKPWMNSFSTVTTQQRKVMSLTGRTGFNHQTSIGTQTFFHQVQVNS